MNIPEPLTHVQKAAEALNAGNFGDAVEHATQALASDPTDVVVRRILGSAYVFSAARYTDPQQQRKYIGVGLKELEKALTVAPGNPQTLTSLASCLSFIGEREQAIGYFKEVIQSTPPRPQPYEGIVSLLIDLERIDDAQPYVAAYFECFRRPLPVAVTSFKCGDHAFESGGISLELGVEPEEGLYSCDADDIRVFGLGKTLQEAMDEWRKVFKLTYDDFVEGDDPLSESGRRYAEQLRSAVRWAQVFSSG